MVNCRNQECQKLSKFKRLIKIRKRNKKFFGTCPEQRRKLRNIIFEFLKDIAVYAFSLGIKFLPIAMVKLNPGDTIEKIFPKSIMLKIFKELPPWESSEFNAAKAKDMCMISDKKYQHLRRILNQQISSNYQVKTIQEKIDKLFEIKTNNHGGYNDTIKKIKYVLNKVYENMKKKKQAVKDDTFD